jgi:hypothetical protein
MREGGEEGGQRILAGVAGGSEQGARGGGGAVGHTPASRTQAPPVGQRVWTHVCALTGQSSVQTINCSRMSAEDRAMQHVHCIQSRRIAPACV